MPGKLWTNTLAVEVERIMGKEKLSLNLYSGLLTISQEAMSAGCYEAAYHTLAAAMHCAESTGITDCFEQVAKVAGEQLKTINETAPGNVMSSYSALDRHGVDMYEVLIRMAKARAQLARNSERRARSIPHTKDCDMTLENPA